jgi:ABC-type multidrug transport system ATPase subunit
MSMNAIELTELTVQAGGRKKVELLSKITATIGSGQVCGLVGHNGAGKTTLIRQILGLTSPHSGQVRVFGLDPRTPDARRGIGYSPERPELALSLTVAETLALHHGLMGAGPWQPTADRCGLGAYLKVRVGRLSKGWQTRVSLACALAGEPRLLVLDEPMSGLDPESRLWVRGMIAGAAQRGATVLFSSHALSDVRDLCQSVMVLGGGHLRYTGPLATLATQQGMTKIVFRLSPQPSELPFLGTWSDDIWHGTLADPIEPCLNWFLSRGGRLLAAEPQGSNLDEVLVQLSRGALGTPPAL